MKTSEQREYPELRFKGFIDYWINNKLGENLQKNNNKNKSLKINNVESISNKSGFIKQTVQFNDYVIASKDLSNYYVIKSKQFAYNPSRINVGSIAYKEENENTSVISPLYVSFSTSNQMNDNFLWYWFKSESFKKQRIIYSEGGVRDTLSYQQLSDIRIGTPLKKEQQKIGDFFKKLDELITLNQDKLGKLKELKKGYLQKMFPSEGETIPELRFKGFDYEWEEKKLRDITSGFKYGLNSASAEYDGKNKYLRITDIDDESRKFIKNNLTSPKIKLDEAIEYQLSDGDILFARTGASVGKTYLYNKNDGIVYFAGFLIRIKANKEHDATFIYQNTLTNSYTNYIKIMSQRSGQPGVNANEYKDFRLMTPLKKEQLRISKLLILMDNLIDKQSKNIEQLKQLKKGYLQKMFV